MRCGKYQIDFCKRKVEDNDSDNEEIETHPLGIVLYLQVKLDSFDMFRFFIKSSSELSFLD